MATKPLDNGDPIQKELADIKRLLVLALVRDGIPQKSVAAALGISEATMSRMFPKGLTSALKASRQNSD